MLSFSTTRRYSLVLCFATLPLSAQELPAPVIASNRLPVESLPPVPAEAPTVRNATDGAITTRKDARAITLKIPAPRGQIVDRQGAPLAQNRVAYQVGLQFRQFDNADRDFVVHWARTRLDALAGVVKNPVPKTDDEVYDHYQNRRWLPLLVSGQISEKEARALEPKLTAGTILHPVYQRYYPEGELAAHIIGYTGSVGKLPTGPINSNEPLWEESEGRAGLEKIFNDQLTGEAGSKRLLFDENGNKLLEEETQRPRPGGSIITTLDLKWQRQAETTLRNGARRGAFVVLDVVTGEVLVMASRPAFNLNDFVPGISEKDLAALNSDPATPLYGRAFQSTYPPASAFKPIVALAALNNGIVTPTSEIYCPASITIGRTTMRNWTTVPEGSINVKRALTRSCNTWFYQIGIKTGPTVFLGLARRLGFGQTSGLPLVGENAGLVPTDEWMMKYHKRRILDGDTANLSIGQGSLLATPLQVAQAMAGIANGSIVPKLQLVRQVQDTRGRVTQAAMLQRKEWLGVEPKAVETVQAGMKNVVNGSGGTGHGASLSYTTLCGKTGTAQWGPVAKNQGLAWFAGYLPAENPRYAFAVLYEGRPGEKVSGSRMAAPLVKKFFEAVKDDIKEVIAPPKKALVVIDESAEDVQPAIPLDPEAGDSEVPLTPESEADPDGGPLRALPVTPLEVEEEIETPEMDEEFPRGFPEEVEPSDEPDAVRAIPVGEDEVIDGMIEEP